MTNYPKDDANIFRSPFFQPDAKIPDVSLTDFFFKSLDLNYEALKDKTWVVDIIKETSYKFSDIKPLTKKFASALTRKGFKKGDILYFVTYDVALIYMIQIAVWRCGGAVRGCFQGEDKKECERQMREISTRFILCDPQTAPSVKWAAKQLDWPVHLLSIGGEVEGATAVEEMITNDDCSAFPHSVEINPKEDVISMPNTSGSTGLPKGAMHTHFNMVAFYSSTGAPVKLESSQSNMKNSILTVVPNYSVGTLYNLCYTLLFGYSIHSLSTFDQKMLLKHIMKYKPERLLLFPYVANWLARTPELDLYDLSFIKCIQTGGSVIDPAIAKLLSTRLPQVELKVLYGITECFFIASTDCLRSYAINNHEEEIVAGLKFKKLDKDVYVSSGPLLPLVEAKIVDSATGCSVGPDIKGDIWVRAPYLMKGYVNSSNTKGFTSTADEDGWFDTGDFGFFDNDRNIYVLGRKSSIFKYYMQLVSPAELEAVIGEHPAVLSVGVVGVPDLMTTSAARAYVMLKPGHQATEEEIKQYVAERKAPYKHLYGGVAFVDSLPESRGGKLDRPALLQKAIAESQKLV